MKIILLLPFFLLFINSTPIEPMPVAIKVINSTSNEITLTPTSSKLMAFDSYSESFYDCLNNSELDYNLFLKGLKGYYSLKQNNKLNNTKYLTLIDFNLASNKRRCFVIDMEKKSIDHQTIIAHGKFSGQLMATKFSNESESKMSSIGFYTTGVIYNGKYDYSLKIHGLEYTNDNAFERGVVIHSADYATEEFLARNGNVLGRSYGCPALPHNGYKEIVDKIKNGSCLFIRGNDRSYTRNSKLLKTNEFINSFYSDFQESHS